MNKLSNYILFFVSAIYFFLIHLFISQLNSSLSQVGFYFFIPSLFLFTPPLLNKDFSLMLIVLNGFLLDYHCNLPYALNVFLLIWVHLVTQNGLKLNNLNDLGNGRALLLLINFSFFIFLYLLTHFQTTYLNTWNPSKFFSDLLTSTILLFFCLRPHLMILQFLTTRTVLPPSEKTMVKG